MDLVVCSTPTHSERRFQSLRACAKWFLPSLVCASGRRLRLWLQLNWPISNDQATRIPYWVSKRAFPLTLLATKCVSSKNIGGLVNLPKNRYLLSLLPIKSPTSVQRSLTVSTSRERSWTRPMGLIEPSDQIPTTEGFLGSQLGTGGLVINNLRRLSRH